MLNRQAIQKLPTGSNMVLIALAQQIGKEILNGLELLNYTTGRDLIKLSPWKTQTLQTKASAETKKFQWHRHNFIK
jgi:hypothetical protein